MGGADVTPENAALAEKAASADKIIPAAEAAHVSQASRTDKGKTMYLRVDRDKCTGCRTCEAACSLTREGVLNRAKSRIRIYRIGVLELEQKVCDQCPERPCVSACPTGAIFEKNGQVRVRKSACDGCGRCVEVCDKLFLSPDDRHAMMCNQCGACVKSCPENALELTERNDA